MAQRTFPTSRRAAGNQALRPIGLSTRLSTRGQRGGMPSVAGNKKKAGRMASGLFEEVLAATYFPTQEYAVSSAMEGLTSEFGMGSGVPPPPYPLNTSDGS